MTLIMSAATVAIGRRCDEKDKVEEIASPLVKKCKNAEKALCGVVTIMEKMEFDEKDSELPMLKFKRELMVQLRQFAVQAEVIYR
ncbi:MAG: hypothetical protein GY816_16665, partial [Cytophagales bacterium]|nr:hypothetical protein [Cytophagales bacterium]